MTITFKVIGPILIERVESRIEELHAEVKREQEMEKINEADRVRRDLDRRNSDLSARLRGMETYADNLAKWYEISVWKRHHFPRPEKPRLTVGYSECVDGMRLHGHGNDPTHTLHRLEQMLKTLSPENVFEMTVDDAMALGLKFNDQPTKE